MMNVLDILEQSKAKLVYAFEALHRLCSIAEVRGGSCTFPRMKEPANRVIAKPGGRKKRTKGE